MSMRLQARRAVVALSLAVVVAGGLAAPVSAQEHMRGGGWHGGSGFGHGPQFGHGPEHWRGPELRGFHRDDIARWRGGHWFNGRHAGRAGWWWIVGGVWYFYPAPIYPYPDPYALPPVVYAPPAVAVVPAPAGSVVAAPATPTFVAPTGQQCREYQSTATIEGTPRMTYGTACLQPDGSWRIVN